MLVQNEIPEPLLAEFPRDIWPLVETDFKYEGHLDRQRLHIERAARQEHRRIPENIDYSAMRLKREAQHRFSEIRPTTIGQAARIPGITPADIALLIVWLEKDHRERMAQSATD